MVSPIVFFDVAGPSETELNAFYRDVFGWQVGSDGNLSVPTLAPGARTSELAGVLRIDPPEKVLYIGVHDISATLESVVSHGGRIDQPRFEVPGVVVLGLFQDPAGNRMGLVELDGNQVRIP